MNESAFPTIVITGGAQGIGRTTALRCARRGDRVAVLDKDFRAAKTVAQEAKALGANGALGFESNVSDEQQVERALAHINDAFGAPWGVFANAAVDEGGWVHELPLETWRRVLDTNLTGVFLTCKHALLRMIEAGRGGSIVSASSPGVPWPSAQAAPAPTALPKAVFPRFY